SAAARRRLHRGFRCHFERWQARLLADDLRDHLVEGSGHVRLGSAGVRTRRAEPGRRGEGMHRARRRGVFQTPERRNVLFMLFQRRKNGAELEAGARAGGSPLVHGGTVRGVTHDRAVRDVEESHAQLGSGGSLRQGRAGRHHRIKKRQPERDSGGLQHRSSRNVFLGEEHAASWPAKERSRFSLPATFAERSPRCESREPNLIQIRDVPDSVRGTLKPRAAREGMSLFDFLKRELELVAERPTTREWFERTQPAKLPAEQRKVTAQSQDDSLSLSALFAERVAVDDSQYKG